MWQVKYLVWDTTLELDWVDAWRNWIFLPQFVCHSNYIPNSYQYSLITNKMEQKGVAHSILQFHNINIWWHLIPIIILEDLVGCKLTCNTCVLLTGTLHTPQAWRLQWIFWLKKKECTKKLHCAPHAGYGDMLCFSSIVYLPYLGHSGPPLGELSTSVELKNSYVC